MGRILFVISLFLLSLPTVHSIAPEIEWSRTFESPYKDSSYSVQQTKDDGYIVSSNQFAIKTDPSGNQLWNKTFDISKNFFVYLIQQTYDEGYLLAGTEWPFETNSSNLWLLKLDSNGVEQWSRTYDEKGFDSKISMQHTSDGGYIIIGNAPSLGNGYDSKNMRIVKLSPINSSKINIIHYYPLNFSHSIAEPNDLSFNISTDAADITKIFWYQNMTLKSESGQFKFLGNFAAAGFYNITAIVARNNLMESLSWNLTVINTNTAPSITLVNLTSTEFLDSAKVTLQASWNFIDFDGDNMTEKETLWYKNGNPQEDYANKTAVNSLDLSKPENWIFSVRIFDGTNWSEWANASILIIKDSKIIPTTAFNVNAVFPANNSVVYEKSMKLKVSSNEYANCNYSLDSSSFKSLLPLIENEGYELKVDTYSKKLELSEDLAAGVINRKILSNITPFIQKGDLKSLGSGIAANSKGAAPYNQYLYLLGAQAQQKMDSGYAVYTQDDNGAAADFLYFKSGRELAKYLLEFTAPFKSGIYYSSGTPSPTGLYLKDFENIDLEMLGKSYTIVSAKRTSTAPSGAELTLMGGLGKGTLLENATETYDIYGKPYEVTLTHVGSDGAQFAVNGQATRKMNKADMYKLSDGTLIGVSEILFEKFAGGIHSATFFIGAQTIILKDTNVANSGKGEQPIKVNNRSISNAISIIEGSDNISEFKINKIYVNMTTEDNLFIAKGVKMSDAIKSAGSSPKPEMIFTQNWDIEYRGLKKENTEKIKLSASAKNIYTLQFIDDNGAAVSIPVTKSPEGSILGNASDSNVILTTRYGAKINITYKLNAPDTILFSTRMPDDDKHKTGTLIPTVMKWNITALNAELRILQDTTTESKRLLLRASNTNPNVSNAYDSYGAFYTYETQENGPESLTIEVPEKQREALVYIVGSYSNYAYTSQVSNLAAGEHNILVRCTNSFNDYKSISLNFKVSEKYCMPKWKCSGYDVCRPDERKNCNQTIDLNGCYAKTNFSSDLYHGNFREFEEGCDYNGDHLIGNLSNMNHNLKNLSVLIINNSVEFKDNNKTIVEFNYNFSELELNFFNITIEKQNSTASRGSVRVRGIPLASLNKTKTVYLNRINGNRVCILDSDVSSTNEITSNCSNPSEISLICDGIKRADYTCTLLDSGYKIEGLRHSAAAEYTFKSIDTNTSVSSGSDKTYSDAADGKDAMDSMENSGFVCSRDWKCNAWSSCIDGLQTRQCNFVKVPQHVQDDECPALSNAPASMQKCEAKKESDKSQRSKSSGKKENGIQQSENPKSDYENFIKKRMENEITGNAASGLFPKTKILAEFKIGAVIVLFIAVSGIIGYKFMRK